MSCEVSYEELMQLLDGDLDEARANELREHVKSCEQCRKRVESLRKLDSALTSLPPFGPPENAVIGARRIVAQQAQEGDDSNVVEFRKPAVDPAQHSPKGGGKMDKKKRRTWLGRHWIGLAACLAICCIVGLSSLRAVGVTADATMTEVADSLQGVGYNMGYPARLPPPGLGAYPYSPAQPSEMLQPGMDTEAYDRIYENPFIRVSQDPLSTFSIDVDTASYSNMRRFLNQGRRPPKDAVRIEELINYFSYDYPQPDGKAPFSVNVEVAGCPWKSEHRLVRVGLKGRDIAKDKRPSCNLVFLLDVSGSMNSPHKLPLVQSGMRMLADQLGADDRVAIGTYAGSAGVALPSTFCSNRHVIRSVIDGLSAGGSTCGSGGILMAYKIAEENFIEAGINRVILATDGDFNVGVTNQGDLTRLIEEKAKSGVFLTVLGFGMGNYKDSTLEKLADKGNGNYAYVDTLNEARKVLVDEIGSTLVTIAKDVKIQIEFNPAQVAAYRLIGYENRVLRHEDFNDDKKDAGEIGAGHTVTALYQVVPVGNEVPGGSVGPLKYQTRSPRRTVVESKELLTVKLRYKEPDGQKSKLLDVSLTDGGRAFDKASDDLRFASAVAAFGMILRGSEHKGSISLDGVTEIAEGARGKDRFGYRKEFLDLVARAKALSYTY